VLEHLGLKGVRAHSVDNEMSTPRGPQRFTFALERNGPAVSPRDQPCPGAFGRVCAPGSAEMAWWHIETSRLSRHT
jgi:hypothetical protein